VIYDLSVILKDTNNAKKGYVVAGKIKKSKAVVNVVCIRTMRMTLTTSVKHI